MKVCGYQENKEGTWKLNHSINVWNKFVTANTLAVHCWLGMTTFHCRSSKKNQNKYFEMGWCPSFGQGRVNFPVVAVMGAAWSRWVHQGCYSTPLTSSPGGRNKGFSLPRRKGVQKVQGVLCFWKQCGTGRTLWAFCPLLHTVVIRIAAVAVHCLISLLFPVFQLRSHEVYLILMHKPKTGLCHILKKMSCLYKNNITLF